MEIVVLILGSVLGYQVHRYLNRPKAGSDLLFSDAQKELELNKDEIKRVNQITANDLLTPHQKRIVNKQVVTKRVAELTSRTYAAEEKAKRDAEYWDVHRKLTGELQYIKTYTKNRNLVATVLMLLSIVLIGVGVNILTPEYQTHYISFVQRNAHGFWYILSGVVFGGMSFIIYVSPKKEKERLDIVTTKLNKHQNPSGL